MNVRQDFALVHVYSKSYQLRNSVEVPEHRDKFFQRFCQDNIIGKTNPTNVSMEDNPELFSENNTITRRDATDSLKEYASKFKWNSNARVLDIGSADGSVTRLLSIFIPKNYEMLIGCDINNKSVKYANTRYGTDRMKFIELDIEEPIPEHLRESFDHVFSFYTLHWLTDPENGYMNIYNLLKPAGECFLVIVAKSPLNDIYQTLACTDKWSPWMQGFDTYVSPYHDCQDPDNVIYESFKKIGFHHIDVRCKQKVFVYESTNILKSSVTAINLFEVPKHMQDEFLQDYIDVARDMRLVGSDDSVKFCYNIIIVHCVK